MAFVISVNKVAFVVDDVLTVVGQVITCEWMTAADDGPYFVFFAVIENGFGF